ncbi:MAG: glycosyltransferase family 4 protein [Candidatus Zixiibacteriota bacterium]|nr:MAG: glycosyltransferase family 4 protein [candidate division Zixibacteria bacterium]
MLRVAYDVTAVTDSPFGGVAQVSINTLDQARKHPDIEPVAYYRSGALSGAPAGLEAARKHRPWHRFFSEPCDITHSLCHRTLGISARKHVYTVYDTWSLVSNPYQPPAFQAKVGRRLRREITTADVVVAISGATRASLIEMGLVDRQKCRVAHLGYTLPADVSAGGSPRLAALTKKKYVLFVGCLEVRKNLGHVIDAVKPLSGVELVIAGHPGYGYHDRVRPRLAELDRDRLHLVNVVTRDELAVLYRHAAATLLPSWEEGFGLPILEAMANGCPVITSNRSANAEIGAPAAILVEPENPAQSREAIEKLTEDAAYRESIVARGRERAAGFSWEKYFDQLVGIYRETLS